MYDDFQFTFGHIAECVERESGTHCNPEIGLMLLVPVAKKGNLTKCNNWRGIALLDVVGKVVARVLQQRLQKWQKRNYQNHNVALEMHSL